MDKRRIRIVVLGVAVLAMLAAFSPQNRADIRILTHEQSDRNPHRMKAVFDVGLIAVSVLITWTEKLAR